MNQLEKGAILSYVSLGVSNVLVLLYTPFLLRMMGQTEFGLYSLVSVVVSALTLLDCGFGPALVRYIVKYRTENEEWKIPNLLAMFLIIYTIIGVICYLLGTILYFNTDLLFDRTMTIEELNKAKFMVLLISVYLSFSFPFSIYSSIVLAYERFVYLKTIQIVRSLLTPTLMVPLLIWGYKSEAMASVLVFTGVFVWVCNVIYCWKSIGIKIRFRSWDRALMIEMMAFSSFVFLKIILERFFWSAGQFIEGMNVGTIAVAILAIALQMRGYFSGFAEALNSILLPKMTNMAFGKSSYEEFNRVFLKIGRLQAHLLGFVLGIYILFGEEFIVLWAGSNYRESYIASLFVMIPCFISLVQILGKTSLEAYNLQKYHVLGILSMNVMMMVFTMFFYKLGVKNAVALSMGLAILICDGLWLNYIYISKLNLKVAQFWSNILNLLFRISVPFLIFYIFHMYINWGHSIYSYIFEIIIMTSLYIAFFPLMVNDEEKNIIKVVLSKCVKK